MTGNIISNFFKKTFLFSIPEHVVLQVCARFLSNGERFYECIRVNTKYQSPQNSEHRCFKKYLLIVFFYYHELQLWVGNFVVHHCLYWSLELLSKDDYRGLGNELQVIYIINVFW